MSNLVTYIVDNMRVTFPEGKIAERNPERFASVKGVFHRTTEAENGTLVKGEKLSYSVKDIDSIDALAPGFSLDLANGILTMPEGERGRKAAPSVSQDAIAARLASLATAPATATNPAPDPASGEDNS